MSTVIKVENLSKQYRLGNVGTGSLAHDINRAWHRIRGNEDPYLKIGDTNDRTKKGNDQYVWALKDINFEVQHGEVLGIIGRNGAGKSTLLKILSRTTSPTTGSVKIKGRVASLLEVGTGFHPELTGRENIFLNGAILGMTKQEIKSKFDEIVDFAGVERYVDTPVKRYSSGMYVRLAFGVAAHLDSEILIVDEVLAVGDSEFQKKCLGKMGEISKGQGRTVLFVSHNMQAVNQLCKNCIVMKQGQLFGSGEVSKIVNGYLATDGGIRIHNKWSDADARGTDSIKLIESFVHYEDATIPTDGNFLVTKKIGITILYKILKEGYTFIHGANVYNNEDINIFNSHDVTSEIRKHKRQIGTYQATMWIPPNLMSEGTFSISIALFVPNPFEIFVHDEKSLSFNIIDEMAGDSARGQYSQSFPGFIRPLLQWEASKLTD